MIDDERSAIQAEGNGTRRPKKLEPGFALVGTREIFKPLEPPDDVIAGVLRRGSLLLDGGYGSGAKTWRMVDAAVAIATGGAWLHRFQCEKGRATIIDYESGSYELRRRIQAVARGRGLDRVDGIDFVTMPGMYLGEPRFSQALERLAAERSVILIDSLRAASTEDENDSRMRRGLDSLRGIGERTGCAFDLLVHAKKISGNPNEIDMREMLRGSSGIFDAADSVLVTIYRRDAERFDAVQAKARHGRAVRPFAIRLVDEDGGVRVVAEDMPDAEATAATTLDGFKRQAIAAVKANAGVLESKNDIAELMKGTRALKLKGITMAIEEKAIGLVEGFFRVTC